MQLVEVRVASAEGEIVLQHKCRDPNVVCGDGGPLTAELAINGSVVMGGLVVRKEDLDAVSDQELVEDPLVFRGVVTDRKSRPEFAQDHKRQIDFVSRLQGF